jgi:hypothetical protein
MRDDHYKIHLLKLNEQIGSKKLSSVCYIMLLIWYAKSAISVTKLNFFPTHSAENLRHEVPKNTLLYTVETIFKWIIIIA